MPPDGAAMRLFRAFSGGNWAVDGKLIPFVYNKPRRLQGGCVGSDAVAAGKPRTRLGWEVQETRGTN